MKKIYILVAIGRTGSNYFCKLLENFPLFISAYELFHNKCTYDLSDSLNEYEQYTGKNFNKICNMELVDYIHEYPENLLDFFYDQLVKSNKQIFSFKIFPEHLDFEKVKSILRRDDVEVFFIKRYPIDSYVSMLKARAIGKWKFKDYTDVKPNIELNQYIKWHERKEEWYKSIKNYLSTIDKKSYTLYYEEFTKWDDSQNLQFILSKMLSEDEYVNTERNKVMVTMKKQDQNDKPEDKVFNWDDFYRMCQASGWDKKLFSYF